MWLPGRETVGLTRLLLVMTTLSMPTRLATVKIVFLIKIYGLWLSSDIRS
jgi:hypothetical protein